VDVPTNYREFANYRDARPKLVAEALVSVLCWMIDRANGLLAVVVVVTPASPFDHGCSFRQGGLIACSRSILCPGRAIGQKRNDQNLGCARFDAKCGMAVPCQFHRNCLLE